MGNGIHKYGTEARFDVCALCGTQWQCGPCKVGNLPAHECTEAEAPTVTSKEHYASLCRKTYAGYGACVLPAEHAQSLHEDANGYLFRTAEELNACKCESSQCAEHEEDVPCASTDGMRHTSELGNVCATCRTNYAEAGYALTETANGNV